ncbi:sensor histidine kinase [Rubritalea tangerina]|uniref:histidine kinase n=1 Tax=Rubritalea tangerina TaxID=430798 RepID=A0ABW4Z6C5_9BACT
MKGNKIIWCVAAACCLIVISAMGVLTHRFFLQSNRDVKQGAEAYQQERVRLAMWRLDTLATSIVGAEDARPAEDLYTQDFRELVALQDLGKNPVAPVYEQNPSYANLYWSINLTDEGEEASSPQVYDEKYLADNKVDPSGNQVFAGNLKAFNRLLGQPVGESEGKKVVDTNFDLTCRSCHDLPYVAVEAEKLAGVPPMDAKNDFSLESLNAEAPTKQKNSKIVLYKNEPEVQQKISKAERGKRQKAVERLSDSYITANVWSQSEQQMEPARAIPVPEMSSFAPIWLDGELVLVRRVQVIGVEKIQGVWLKKNEVVEQLLDEIIDLFPSARLEPYFEGDKVSESENAMLRLPFVLIPGERALSSVRVTVSDLFVGPIGFAWLGTLLALAAGFFMLRAVLKMSERRASFVSSVTHELRTPLTTFRLYSDMLSSGLVKDEPSKQKYLETLRVESERLTHLVENVLAYSRIERGSARAKLEEVGLGCFIERVRGRLEERAAEAGLQLVVGEVAEGVLMEIDATAVEQILFNLVDNAAKYATGDGCGSRIDLNVELGKRSLSFVVCDEGPGVARWERRKLFRPFHKSAEQAASSKPGVGLGLALCRRLAKEMGGNLGCRNAERGACFVLKLPLHQKRRSA